MNQNVDNLGLTQAEWDNILQETDQLFKYLKLDEPEEDRRDHSGEREKYFKREEEISKMIKEMHEENRKRRNKPTKVHSHASHHKEAEVLASPKYGNNSNWTSRKHGAMEKLDKFKQPQKGTRYTRGRGRKGKTINQNETKIN